MSMSNNTYKNRISSKVKNHNMQALESTCWDLDAEQSWKCHPSSCKNWFYSGAQSVTAKHSQCECGKYTLTTHCSLWLLHDLGTFRWKSQQRYSEL